MSIRFFAGFRLALLFFLFGARGWRRRGRRHADLDGRGGAEVRPGRHRRDVAGVEDVRARARGARTAGTDEDRDGNARGEDCLDDLAHRGIEPAGCVDLQHDELRAFAIGAREPARHIIGGRRSDRAGKRQYDRRRRLSAGRACGKRDPRRREDLQQHDLQQLHHLHAKSLAEAGMDDDYCRKRARPRTGAKLEAAWLWISPTTSLGKGSANSGHRCAQPGLYRYTDCQSRTAITPASSTASNASHPFCARCAAASSLIASCDMAGGAESR